MGCGASKNANDGTAPQDPQQQSQTQSQSQSQSAPSSNQGSTASLTKPTNAASDSSGKPPAAGGAGGAGGADPNAGLPFVPFEKLVIRDLDFALLKRITNVFSHFDPAKDRRLFVCGRARGGFNLRTLLISDTASATVWKCDVSAIDEFVDSVTAYTILTESLVKRSFKIVGSRRIADVIALRKEKEAATAAAKNDNGNGNGNGNKSNPEIDQSLAVDTTSASSSASSSGSASASPAPRKASNASGIVLVNHEAPALVLQLPIAPYMPEEVQRTSSGLWPEDVPCSLNARNQLCFTCERIESIEETQRLIAEMAIAMYESIPTRKSSLAHQQYHSQNEFADDEMRSPDKFRIVPGVQYTPSSAAPEHADHLPPVSPNAMELVNQSAEVRKVDDKKTDGAPSAEAAVTAAAPAPAPASGVSPMYLPMPLPVPAATDSSAASPHSDASSRSDKGQPEAIRERRKQLETDISSTEQEIKKQWKKLYELRASKWDLGRATVPEGSDVHLQRNPWRDRHGTLEVRKYGDDTSLPIVRILALISDLREMFHERPDLSEYSKNVRVQDLDYVEEVLAKNKQYNPEFIARNRDTTPDEETGEFLIQELTPYQKSAVETLSISLTTIKSVLAFTRVIRKHAAVTYMQKEMSSVFRENFPELKAFLDDNVRWDWNVFEFSHVARGRPLYTLAMAMMFRYELFEKLGLNFEKVKNFFMDVENNYLNNPYHNRIHGSDVLQTMLYFIEHGGYKQFLTSVDILGVIIASAAHDVGHPGLANPFQIKTMSSLALRFNNQSVLENFHCAFTFELLLKDNNNFLADLEMENRLYLRDLIINLILATDMGRNFEYLGKFQTQLIRADGSKFRPANPDELKLMLQLFIKAADVSNPAKSMPLYAGWVSRVMEEFFEQGDKERSMGMSISPFMNRETTDIGKCQLGFMDYVTLPLYETLGNFDKLFMPCLDQLLKNKAYWKEKVSIGQNPITPEMNRASSTAQLLPSKEDDEAARIAQDAENQKPQITDEWKNEPSHEVGAPVVETPFGTVAAGSDGTAPQNPPPTAPSATSPASAPVPLEAAAPASNAVSDPPLDKI
eukprot:ANDGO_04310.mRNA.1 putative 3'